MRATVLAVMVALGGVGCASSAEIRQGAYEHLAKAQRLEAAGDYYHAEKERAAANKQFNKARQRSYEEAYYGGYLY